MQPSGLRGWSNPLGDWLLWWGARALTSGHEISFVVAKRTTNNMVDFFAKNGVDHTVTGVFHLWDSDQTIKRERVFHLCLEGRCPEDVGMFLALASRMYLFLLFFFSMLNFFFFFWKVFSGFKSYGPSFVFAFVASKKKKIN